MEREFTGTDMNYRNNLNISLNTQYQNYISKRNSEHILSEIHQGEKSYSSFSNKYKKEKAPSSSDINLNLTIPVTNFAELPRKKSVDETKLYKIKTFNNYHGRQYFSFMSFRMKKREE